MKYVMLLVIISDADIGSKLNITAIGTDYIIDYLKDCCLTGSVITYYCHMITSTQTEADIGKQPMVVGFGKVCNI